ncbi:MAG: site-specific integrase [Betaproteobacteria bacterium]|nr:site-specific integrase [Betaproteobacteria bacterium]
MVYRRKDSPVYWGSFTDASGERVRRTTGTTSRREAEALEAKWKLEAHQVKRWGAEPSRTFDQLMLEYTKATQAVKRSAERDGYTIERLAPFFTGRNLLALKRSDIRAYIDKRLSDGVANGTINKEIGLFSAAINYARRNWDWDIPNPAEGMRLKAPEGRVRSLTVEEAERLITEAERSRKSPHLADFIRLALNTGCRRGELLKLQWSRVDLKANLFFLGEQDTKTGRRRSVPLNAQARTALLNLARFRASYCPDSPWVFAHKDGSQQEGIRTAFLVALKNAGIADFRIHDLRHTCASWLVSAGQPLPAVRDLLGHSTVTMTERYAHLSPENVRAAVAVLDGVSRSGHAEREKATTASGDSFHHSEKKVILPPLVGSCRQPRARSSAG